MPRYTQHIGPPHTPFRGMNTRDRRQQVAPTEFYGLRNAVLSGGALQTRPGLARLLCGARTAKSLKGTVAGGGEYVSLSHIDDYDLSTRYTVFIAYSRPSFGTNAVVAQEGATAQTWKITHQTNGKIVAVVTDSVTTATLTSSGTFKEPDYEYQVQLVRNGATTTLYVNGSLQATDATLSATLENASGNAILVGACIATLYEFRLFRVADTTETWRNIQYPWSGKFGDPNLVAHLTFEDGTGTTVTDHSRNGNDATITGAGWSWLSSTKRQTVTPVTGVHVMENARGRKWLLFDVGVNHYRVPLN